MAEQFEHGYAVVVGVDQNSVAAWALPDVAKDVQALHEVLVHPERCAYKPENVKLLLGENSTASKIMEALFWLQEQVEADENATAVIYYTGHGFVDTAADQYYLIPYDVESSKKLRIKAIKAEAFAAQISDILARRLLVVLDCCHAGGMGAKDISLETAVAAQPFPLENMPVTKDIPAYEPGSKVVSDLLEGEGRAVLNSSTGAQRSYVRPDGTMSLFTFHFIEALTGHAPHADEDKVVYVTDVMSWVTRQVKKSAEKIGVEQTPVMRTSGVFPVAQLIGGQGVAKGVGQEPPDPFSLPVATTIKNNTFKQENQTVGGHQANIIAEKVTIDHFGDNKTKNVTMGERSEYVEGNKTIYGDEVKGDKVGGDVYNVGDVSGTGFVIGRGGSAHGETNTGISPAELSALFAPLVATVSQQNPTAVSQVQTLQEEVKNPEKADDEKIADLIESIAEAAPLAVEGLVNLFTNSIAAKAAGKVTNFVIKKLKKKKSA